MISKIIKFINRETDRRDDLFLSIVILFFSLLRIPSSIEPYWYGDEGIYQVIAMAMNRGRLLYQEIWDNKPPLLYVIYSIFDGDLFYVRLLSLFAGVISLIFFFLLAKKLFKNSYSVHFSTGLFAFMFALPVLEGNIANSENFMILPIIGAFYFAFSASKTKRFSHMIFAGLLLSIAFLIKIVAIFDFVALLTAVFILRFYESFSFNGGKIKNQISNLVTGLKQEAIFIISFALPIIVTILYFFIKNSFADFYKAVFSQNIGYVGHGNFLFFPMGFLYLKLFLLLFSLLLIIRYRKEIKPGGVLIMIWLAFSILNALFSQRPYTHYLLVLLPSFSLFLGYILDNKKILKLTLPILVILIIVLASTFKINFKRVVPYYLNYFDYILSKKSVSQYRSFFDKNTNRDYNLASFIRTKTQADENIFLWSDSGQIYALAGKLPPGRYIVSYHMTFYKDAIEETKKAIDKNKPKYIIQTKDNEEINNFLTNYDLKFIIDNENIYERQP